MLGSTWQLHGKGVLRAGGTPEFTLSNRQRRDLNPSVAPKQDVGRSQMQLGFPLRRCWLAAQSL